MAQNYKSALFSFICTLVQICILCISSICSLVVICISGTCSFFANAFDPDCLVSYVSDIDRRSHQRRFVLVHKEIWKSDNEKLSDPELDLLIRYPMEPSDSGLANLLHKIEIAIINKHQQAESSTLESFGKARDESHMSEFKNRHLRPWERNAQNMTQIVEDHHSCCVLQTIFAWMAHEKIQFDNVNVFFKFMNVIRYESDMICSAIRNNYIPYSSKLDKYVQRQLQDYMNKYFVPDKEYATKIEHSWLTNDIWPKYAQVDVENYYCIPGISISHSALYTLVEQCYDGYRVDIFKKNTVIEFVEDQGVYVNPEKKKHYITYSWDLVLEKRYRLLVTAAGNWRRCLINEVLEFKGHAPDGRPVFISPELVLP